MLPCVASMPPIFTDLTYPERSIETNKRNFTRFLILADPLIAGEERPSERFIDKSSVVFTLPHDKGRSVQGADHPVVLRHQSHQNPVDAYPWPRVGIPFLYRP